MATHRHHPTGSRNTSAAGASAAVSVVHSVVKGSTSSIATNWASILGFSCKHQPGVKGHHGSQHWLLPASKRQLACLALLLMLPLMFLVTTHWQDRYSISSNSPSLYQIQQQTYAAASSSSSSFTAGRKMIDLDNLDLSKWEPLPKNYQAAKAIATASKSESDSSSSSSNGVFYCIPPSRATPWDQVDAEISHTATAAAAVGVTGQQEEAEQAAQAAQQQQWQQEWQQLPEDEIVIDRAIDDEAVEHKRSLMQPQQQHNVADGTTGTDSAATVNQQEQATSPATASVGTTATPPQQKEQDGTSAATSLAAAAAATAREQSGQQQHVAGDVAAEASQAAAPKASTAAVDAALSGQPEPQQVVSAATATPAATSANPAAQPKQKHDTSSPAPAAVAASTDVPAMHVPTTQQQQQVAAVVVPTPTADASGVGAYDTMAAAVDAYYYDADAAASTYSEPHSSRSGTSTASASVLTTTEGWESYYDSSAADDGEQTNAAAAAAATVLSTAASLQAAGTSPPAASNSAGSSSTGSSSTSTGVPAAAAAEAAVGTAAPAALGKGAAATASAPSTSQPSQEENRKTADNIVVGEIAYKPLEPEQPKDAAVAVSAAANATATATAASSTSKTAAGGEYEGQFDAPTPTATPTAVNEHQNSNGASSSSNDTASSNSSPAAATPSPAPPAAAPPINVAEVASQMNIALVNDVEFHHEVTLGLMSALQKHKDRLTVYLHDSLFKDKEAGSNAFDFLSYVESVMPGNRLRNAYYKEGISKTDVAIFVSPEFSINYYREFIRRATPKMLIVFIHEPNMELRRLQYIINMHPLVGVVALSPHVAEIVKTRMRMHHVHWMMPVLSVHCSNTCWEGFAVQGKFEGTRRSYASLWEAMSKQLSAMQTSQAGQPAAAAAEVQVTPAAAAATLTQTARRLHEQSAELAGAADQPQQHLHRPQRSQLQAPNVFDFERGLKLSGSVNDATKQWRARLQHRRSLQNTIGSSSKALKQTAASAAASSSPAANALPRINLMGSGKLSAIEVPQELRPYVHVYHNLRYSEYYDTLCRSVALLPLFNESSGYLKDKISSTVLASVATAIPMVVPQKFLEVYEAFKSEHVILMDESQSKNTGSGELALITSLAAPESQAAVTARRKALERLRYVLNAHATAKLEGLMAAAHGRPHATTKQD